MNKRRIVCYGDSNTWGYCAATGCRYDDDQRWVPMLQELLAFIDREEAARRYRGLDWSVELRAAQGDAQAVAEMLQRFDIEPLSPGEGVAFL